MSSNGASQDQGVCKQHAKSDENRSSEPKGRWNKWVLEKVDFLLNYSPAHSLWFLDMATASSKDMTSLFEQISLEYPHLNSIRDSAIITDHSVADEPIVFCNNAFTCLTGYSKEEILGRNCRFLQGTHTDQKSIFAIRQALKAGSRLEIELLNYRRDGVPFVNGFLMLPVHEAGKTDGVVTHFLAVQKNVTVSEPQIVCQGMEIGAESYQWGFMQCKILLAQPPASRFASLCQALQGKVSPLFFQACFDALVSQRLGFYEFLIEEEIAVCKLPEKLFRDESLFVHFFCLELLDSSCELFLKSVIERFIATLLKDDDMAFDLETLSDCLIQRIQVTSLPAQLREIFLLVCKVAKEKWPGFHFQAASRLFFLHFVIPDLCRRRHELSLNVQRMCIQVGH